LPPHLKRERIEHDLPEAEKHCGSCDEDLRPIGEETSERYEYIPAQLLVIEDVCKKYACGCTVKTATKPPQPIEKSAAGASLLAQVIVGKIADHLPVHRQAKIFRRFGAEIPDQTMCGWMRQSAQLLDPLYARLKHFVLSSKVVGTDDTPVKVLDRNLKRTTLSAQLLALTCRAGVGEPCRRQLGRHGRQKLWAIDAAQEVFRMQIWLEANRSGLRTANQLRLPSSVRTRR
jgi:transposase